MIGVVLMEPWYVVIAVIFAFGAFNDTERYGLALRFL